jgi:hypothetical protein
VADRRLAGRSAPHACRLGRVRGQLDDRHRRPDDG